MTKTDLTVEICGMSGDGTIAAGELLNAAASKMGFSIIAFDSYPAEIRGFGRCVTRSRIGDKTMLAFEEESNILISLDDEQSLSRIHFLSENATIIFDNKPPSYLKEDYSIAAHVKPGMSLIGAPFSELASSAAGSTRGRNMVSLGVFAAITGADPVFFRTAIENKFKSKGEKILSDNLKCFEAGFNFIREKTDYGLLNVFSSYKNNEYRDMNLLSGSLAIAKGAIDAGLKLYFGYPITPATPIMEYLASYLPKNGGRVIQMEDEISSIGAVLGSFYAGTRAMTATSGPGFALMTELIAHGVMAEIPAVIVNAQRGGPGTGLPTKTEQSDLHAAVFGGPGDSARIVLAPSNVKECYEYTLKSFKIAEKYQTVVIILTDFFLNNRVENVAIQGVQKDDIIDGNIFPDKNKSEDYKRYSIKDSGISPRSIPGMEGLMFTATGLEHSEKGMPDYSPDNHQKMSDKRYRKIQGSLIDLFEPEEFSQGSHLDVGVITWGSTFGSVLEAVQRWQEKGMMIGAMKISSLYPFHAHKISAFMEKCDKVMIPEMNREGQLANLIGHLHRKEIIRFNRVTGQPFSVSEIYHRIEELI